MSLGNGEPHKPDAESGSPTTDKETKEATKKIIRVLTVIAYLSSVSLAAIMLSLYYIFLWNPMPTHSARIMPDPPPYIDPAMDIQPTINPENIWGTNIFWKRDKEWVCKKKCG